MKAGIQRADWRRQRCLAFVMAVFLLCAFALPEESGGEAGEAIASGEAGEDTLPTSEPPESGEAEGEDTDLSSPEEEEGGGFSSAMEDEDGAQGEEAEETPPLFSQSGEELLEEGDGKESLGFSVSNRLSPHEALVDNYTDFKTALQSAQVTHIYLGADIVMTGGIQVNPNKAQLIIEGQNPLADDGRIYSITDVISPNQDATIYLNQSGTLKQVILRDIVLLGANYYGTFSVYDVVSGVHILYDNVEYYGPQLTFNRNGSVRYKDTAVQIGYLNGSNTIGELAECPFVEFEGTVTVQQVNPQGNEIIYVALQPGTIDILEDAQVTVTALGDSGFLYTEAAAKVAFTVHEGATFSFTAPRRFWRHYGFSSVTVKKGGRMFVNITEQITHNGLLRVDGDTLVEEDGVLHLTAQGNGTLPALVANGGSVTFQNPRSILIRNPNGRAIYYAISKEFTVTAQQVNYWRAAGDGGFEDPPLYGWRKADESDITIKGTVSTGDTGNFTTITSNYTPEDSSASDAPSASTFNMVTGRVLAFGRLPLLAEYYDEPGSEPVIAGETAPQALIDVRRLEDGGDTSLGATQADDFGLFSLEAPALNVWDFEQVRVRANHWYLTQEVTLAPVTPVLRFLNTPGDLVFQPVELSAQTVYALRKDPDWSIVIWDTRGEGSQWKLMARVLQPLTPNGPVGGVQPPVLEHALVIRRDGEEPQVLERDRDLVILEHTSQSQREITSVSWSGAEGPAVRLEPGEGYAEVEYEAVIRWTLQNAP